LDGDLPECVVPMRWLRPTRNRDGLREGARRRLEQQPSVWRGPRAPFVRDAAVVETAVMKSWQATITPVLTVADAAAAVGFYERVFDAREVWRTVSPDGKVVAELAVADARLRVADEAPESGNLGPRSLGGSAVRINLFVSDPDAVVERAVAAGATEIAAVADQPYGLRQGRLEDPFGHHWLIGRPLADETGDGARAGP
jgi:PhnB protein